MKIAVLSDIHGNDIAFEAVIDDAKARGAEMFIIAGDLISDYPMSAEVIKRAKALTPYVVKGNREKYFEKYFTSQDLHWKEYKQFEALLWTFNRMTEEDFDYIFSLQEQITIKLSNNKSIMVAHHSPFNIYNELDPDKSMEDIELAISGITDTVLICGHSHKPFVKYFNDKLFINPGSVGVNFSGSFTSEYAMLDYTYSQITTEVLYVSYDETALKDLLKKSGILKNEDARHWFNLVLRSQEDGINYFHDFFELSEELKANHGYTCYDMPNDIWDMVIETFKQRKIL